MICTNKGVVFVLFLFLLFCLFVFLQTLVSVCLPRCVFSTDQGSSRVVRSFPASQQRQLPLLHAFLSRSGKAFHFCAPSFLQQQPSSQPAEKPAFGVFCLYLCVGGSQVSSLVRAPAGLVIERLRIRILAGVAGEVLSLESTLCADSYSVSVPPLCYRSGT